MIPWLSVAWRRQRLEKQAYAWVVRIIDDRDRHADGLRRWIGRDHARADIYNSAYRAARDAQSPAERLFGNHRERSSWIPAPEPRISRLHLGLAVGFSLLLAGAGVALGIRVLGGRIGAAGGHPTDAASEIATRIGEIRTVRLADGSRVVIDTDSVLRVAFTKATRAVQLERGRARFEVAHNATWPFIVSAGGGTVTARGTVFDVAMSDTVQVHLLSGTIDVRYPAPAHRPAPGIQHLTAGQQVRYDPAMSKDPAAPAQGTTSDAQWVSGMRTFDDVPIADIIEEANRYSDTKIMLADPSLGQHEAFLDLDVRHTREVAANLAIYLGLAVDETKPGILLLTASR